MRWVAAALLAAALGGSIQGGHAAAAGPPATPVQADGLRRLEVWLVRARRARGPLESEALRELRGLLGEVQRLEEAEPARGPEVRALLLRLAALEGAPEVRGLGERALEERLDGPAGPAVARALAHVAGDAGAETAERVVAARLLEGRHVPGTLEGLLAAARSPEADLSEAGVAALAGWRDAGLDAFFLEVLAGDGRSWAAAERHFASQGEGLAEGVRGRLRRVVGELLLSQDWRAATRALSLLPLFDGREAVPLLIESLRAWNRRLEQGGGSLRVRHEIVLELRRISARTIGPDPEDWERWWQRVDEGTVALPEEGEGESFTRSSFFGLRIVSDRVVFVLDRSASMEIVFGSGGRTRFVEALDRLDAFLEEAGPKTRFGVVLFSDRPDRFDAELEPAGERERKRLRRWLERKGTDGGTRLREAVFEAAAYQDGELRLEELEADTIVVLCDGETESGPGWVRPWLERVNDRAQLLFHCVQIGSQGDDTLRRLAELTGGTFLVIPG